MESTNKSSLKSVGVVLIVLAFFIVQVVGALKQNKPVVIVQSGEKQVGGTGSTRATYDVIGTAAASSTLTGTYSDNRKVLDVTGLENLHLDIRYSTASASSTAKYAYILIEGSNDGGTTYFPMSSKVVATQEIDIYVKDLDGNIGLPLIFPGDKVTANTTTYKGFYDTNFVADHIRISAKEAVFGTGTAGNIFISATLTSTN